VTRQQKILLVMVLLCTLGVPSAIPVACTVVGGGVVPTPIPTPTATPTPAPGFVPFGIFVPAGGTGQGYTSIDTFASNSNFLHQLVYDVHFHGAGTAFPGTDDATDYNTTTAVQQANDPSPGTYSPRIPFIATSAGNKFGDCNSAINNLLLGNGPGSNWGNNNNPGPGGSGFIDNLADQAFDQWANVGGGISTPNPNQIPLIWRVCYEFNHGTPQPTAANFITGMQFLVNEFRAELVRKGCGPTSNNLGSFGTITGPGTFPTCTPQSVIEFAWNASADGYTVGSGVLGYWPKNCTWNGVSKSCMDIVSIDCYDTSGSGLYGRLSSAYALVTTAQTNCSYGGAGSCITSDGTSTNATGQPLPYLLGEMAAGGGPGPPAKGGNQGYYLVPNYTTGCVAPFFCFQQSITQSGLKTNFPRMLLKCTQGSGTQIPCGGLNYFSSGSNPNVSGQPWSIQAGNIATFGAWFNSTN
jgi:hypothetical protein